MSTWKSIWSLLSQELIHRVPPPSDSWHEVACKQVPFEAVEQDFRQGELPYLSEIGSAIDGWTIDGEWLDLSDGARHCIRLRLNAAVTFVHLLFVSQEAEPFLLPPPERTEREVVRWLLTTWWDRHGRSWLAREICVRQEPDTTQA